MSKISVANSGIGRLNLVGGVSLNPGTIGPGGVLEAPGLTSVDSKAWDKCKEHHITKHYLSTRRVMVVGSSGSAAPTPKPEGLAGMTAKKAINYIAGCDDVDELEAALGGDSRVTVQEALNKRLGEISDGHDADNEAADNDEDYGGED